MAVKESVINNGGRGLQNGRGCEPGPATQTQKRGRMIVLQNRKLPLSTDFFTEKNTFFSKTLTFEVSKWTLFLQNADFCGIEMYPYSTEIKTVL